MSYRRHNRSCISALGNVLGMDEIFSRAVARLQLLRNVAPPLPVAAALPHLRTVGDAAALTFECRVYPDNGRSITFANSPD